MKSFYLDNLENFWLDMGHGEDLTHYDAIADKLDNTLKYRMGKYEDLLDFFGADVALPSDVLGAR